MWNLKKTSECNRTEIDSTDTQTNLIVIRGKKGKTGQGDGEVQTTKCKVSYRT